MPYTHTHRAVLCPECMQALIKLASISGYLTAALETYANQQATLP